MVAGGLISKMARAGIEGFQSSSSQAKKDIYLDFLGLLLGYLVAMVLMGFIGKWLWNSVITDLFSFAKPAKSFWQVVGLMIFVSIMLP